MKKKVFTIQDLHQATEAMESQKETIGEMREPLYNEVERIWLLVNPTKTKADFKILMKNTVEKLFNIIAP